MLLLKKEVQNKLWHSAGVRGRICAELNVAYSTVQRWVQNNYVELTLATSLKIISEAFKLTSEQMLEEVEVKQPERMKTQSKHRAKLTPKQVLEIRRRLAKGDNRTKIATDFEITFQTIADIHKRRTWKRLKA